LAAAVRQSYFPFFTQGHFMTLSNVTRRGMIGGLAAGVSAAAVISSDRLIGSARAQSAQKTNTTSGHSVMITEPEWLTGILLQTV
jgi:hypothetical protein